MSDRYTGTIDILKKDIARHPELEKAVKDEFYTPDGKHLYDTDNWDEKSPIASFKNDNARNGQFDEIEELCVKLKVPFDRWSAAYDEGPVNVAYRPGINGGKPIYMDGDAGDITFTAADIRAIADGLDIDNPWKYHELGRRFANFLKKIPVIRPLIEYIEPEKETA